MIDGVFAAEHRINLVDDDITLVDVMVGQSYLLLPHINGYKSGDELVFES